jgi:hypothetical protein
MSALIRKETAVNRKALHASLAMMFLAGISGQAMAVCAGTQLTDASPGTSVNLAFVLSGNTICVGSGPIFQNQEYHQAGGIITDFKKGPGDSVDPTKDIGTWLVSGSGPNTIVTYNYAGAGVYAFTVFDQGGGNLAFCSTDGATLNTLAKFKPLGPAACP